MLLSMETELEGNPKKLNQKIIECEAFEIWNTLGKTWALLILRNLSTRDATRFNEIKKMMPQISNTVLSERLRELEHEGLITKKIYAQVPIRVEYSLTKQAKELESILEDLGSWIAKWKKEKSKKS